MQRKKKPWKIDENEREKEKCALCEFTLSDEEDDDFKSIGCGICPKWFHFKCILVFIDSKYEDMNNVHFSYAHGIDFFLLFLKIVCTLFNKIT